MIRSTIKSLVKIATYLDSINLFVYANKIDKIIRRLAELSSDIIELLEIFNSNNVKYVVIGGYAFKYYTGNQRTLKDLDIFVEPTKENCDAVIKSLKEFGFGSLGISTEDLMSGKIVMFGVPPNRVDIFSSLPDFSWDEIYNNSVSGILDSVPVLFMSRDDLIKAKKKLGRPSDFRDITELEKQ